MKNQNNTSEAEYLQMGTQIREIFAQRALVSQQGTEWQKSINALREVAGKFPSTSRFSQIESELNAKIANVSIAQPANVTDLTNELDALCPKLTSLAQGVDALELEVKNFEAMPDKYGSRHLAKQIQAFVKDTSHLSLSNLKKAEAEMDKLNSDIRSVHQDFGNDKLSLEAMQQKAQKLLNDVRNRYAHYRDDHEIRAWCVDAEDLCSRFLGKIPVEMVTMCQIELSNLEDRLNHIIQEFEDDNYTVQALCNKLNNAPYLMWNEDRASFLNKYACYSFESYQMPVEAQNDYDRYRVAKNDNLNELNTLFWSSIIDHFSSRINYLRTASASRNEFNRLKGEMETYKKELIKKRIILALKCAGIIAAVVLLILIIQLAITFWFFSIPLIALIGYLYFKNK